LLFIAGALLGRLRRGNAEILHFRNGMVRRLEADTN